MSDAKPPANPANDAAGRARATGAAPARAAGLLQGLLDQNIETALYLVSTPIGNLADMTFRAVATLARADLVFAEDTRHSRRLLDHYAVSRRLEPYHEHNAKVQRPRILAALAEGRSVAVLSDAGTPLVSDPGYKLAREVIDAGHKVIAIPGASAPIAALTCAGLPTDAFFFAGFLPPRSAARKSRLAALAKVPATLLFFEAPGRLAETLSDMATCLGSRQAVVARELTKLHEDVERGELAELAARFGKTPVKGEIVILVAPPSATEVSDQEITSRLEHALNSASLRDAARSLADELNVPKTRIYDLGLKLKREAE